MREEAAECIGIGRVECTRSPEEITDIHQEAVEMIDVISWILVHRRRWRIGQRRLEGSFICSKYGTQSGKVVDVRMVKRKKVYSVGKGCDDPDMRMRSSVRDSKGESFVIR